MNRLRTLLRTRPGLVLGLLLCALFARVVVPAGFMPSQAATGLEICWGGAAPMLLDAGDTGTGGDTHDRVHAPCAFASLAAAAAPPSSSLLVLAPLLRARLSVAHDRAAPAARVAYLRPPLRGPPVPA